VYFFKFRLVFKGWNFIWHALFRFFWNFTNVCCNLFKFILLSSQTITTNWQSTKVTTENDVKLKPFPQIFPLVLLRPQCFYDETRWLHVNTVAVQNKLSTVITAQSQTFPQKCKRAKNLLINSITITNTRMAFCSFMFFAFYGANKTNAKWFSFSLSFFSGSRWNR
jgi:hypothetical protein